MVPESDESGEPVYAVPHISSIPSRAKATSHVRAIQLPIPPGIS